MIWIGAPLEKHAFERFCHESGRRGSSRRANTAKIRDFLIRVFLEGSHMLKKRWEAERNGPKSIYKGIGSYKTISDGI